MSKPIPAILWYKSPVGRVVGVRHSIAGMLAALLIFATSGSAQGNEDRCRVAFPNAEWISVDSDGPMSVATSGMPPEMAARFAGDVARVASMVQAELGGLDGAVACLATPGSQLDVSDLVAEGQRLHVAVFGEEKILVISAVEIRMVADSFAFGIPHIALWQLADDLGLTDGYPEPLATTIGHWYLARDNGRLDRYHSELVVQLFLDDPNPAERTSADATRWTAGNQQDPLLFDPQFVASPMGDFIDYAVGSRGVAVLRDPSQETWGPLENEWRVALRDELLAGRTGSWGAEWGVAIVVFFVLLAALLGPAPPKEAPGDATTDPSCRRQPVHVAARASPIEPRRRYLPACRSFWLATPVQPLCAEAVATRGSAAPWISPGLPVITDTGPHPPIQPAAGTIVWSSRSRADTVRSARCGSNTIAVASAEPRRVVHRGKACAVGASAPHHSM